MATNTRIKAACSFCLKSSVDVGRLVAGPGVYICNECVELSEFLIKNTPKGSVQMAAWEHPLELGVVLDNLPRVAAAGAQVEDNLRHWVAKARELGASWAVVGDSLGMSRQSAWERFGSQPS
jgi:hypothetical protein